MPVIFTRKSEERSIVHDIVRIPVPYLPIMVESKEIVVHRFEPSKSSPEHELIFLHGIKNHNIPYLMWFAKRFARAKVRTWFLILPYHGERAPKDWEGGEPFFSSSPSWCVQRFNEAVKDVLEVHAFIRNEAGSTLPISVMGVSFGGMIAIMALAQNPSLYKGIVCCAGGDWHWINWHSPYLERVRKEYAEKANEFGCQTEKDCVEKYRKNVEEVIKSFNSLNDIFEKAPITCYHYDPASFAPFVRQKILFVQPLFDRIIPRQSYRILRSFLKHKKVLFLPTGHKSFYLLRRFVARAVLSFLKE